MSDPSYCPLSIDMPLVFLERVCSALFLPRLALPLRPDDPLLLPWLVRLPALMRVPPPPPPLREELLPLDALLLDAEEPPLRLDDDPPLLPPPPDALPPFLATSVRVLLLADANPLLELLLEALPDEEDPPRLDELFDAPFEEPPRLEDFEAALEELPRPVDFDAPLEDPPRPAAFDAPLEELPRLEDFDAVFFAALFDEDDDLPAEELFEDEVLPRLAELFDAPLEAPRPELLLAALEADLVRDEVPLLAVRPPPLEAFPPLLATAFLVPLLADARPLLGVPLEEDFDAPLEDFDALFAADFEALFEEPPRLEDLETPFFDAPFEEDDLPPELLEALFFDAAFLVDFAIFNGFKVRVNRFVSENYNVVNEIAKIMLG